MEEPTFEQLMDEVDKLKEAAQEKPESPYDTESEIKVVKSFLTRQTSDIQDQIMHDSEEKVSIQQDSDSDLKSIPDDDLRSISEFEAGDSDDTHNLKVSRSEHISQDENASAERLSVPDHLDHIYEEVSSLHSKLKDMQSSIVQQVSTEIESSLPALITTALTEQLLGLLLSTLKECLSSIELSKVLKSEMGQSVTSKVCLGMEEVRDDISSQSKHQILSECYGYADPTARRGASTAEDIAPSDPKADIQEEQQPDPQTTNDHHASSVNEDTTLFLPTPPKEPTPLRDTYKGKEVATKEPKNKLVAYMEEGGSDQKKMRSFITSGRTLSQEDFMAQLKEIKRTNPSPITKISYINNSQKEATMRITRGNDPLNLTVYLHFRLRMLGFSEWLEVYALASKKLGKSYDVLVESLKEKFQWVLNQAKKLGPPPSPELATFGMTAEDKKRKRTEFLKEVFVKERTEVDGSQRNLTHPGVVGKKGLVIREPEAGFFYYNVNFDLVFLRELEFHITSTVQLIRLQKNIVQDSPKAKEMYRIMKLEIESRLSIEEPLSARLSSDEDQLSAKHQLFFSYVGRCDRKTCSLRNCKKVLQLSVADMKLVIYLQKNRPAGDAPLDNRRKFVTGRNMASTTSSRSRQALAPVTTNQKEVAAAPSEAQVPEDENMEFTKEEVDALLKQPFKGKTKDWVTCYIRRLKTCIKCFQRSCEDFATDKDNLSNKLDLSKRNSAEAEAAMKKKEEDFNATICKLEANIASLKASLANEESQKLDALQREKEAGIISEKNQVSFKEELQRVENEAPGFKEKVKTHEEMYTRLQVLSLLLKDSRDEAVKEVGILRGELQQVREDRERQLLLVRELTSELARFKKSIECTAADVDNLSIKSSALEETCSSQRDQISLLQCQLAAANQKFKMADLSSSEIRTEYEDQKRIVADLQDRLREAENQLLDGEKLRKKLHNNILELKGNIRVFCRVRPLLPDDGPGAEPTVTYPTSAELAGRRIDLNQSGQKHSFTFDKVFAHDASQQDVFQEISQLVQSALDGYKVCIFAYGQTGSGKTYTMMGRPEAPLQKGLIPRSLEQVFLTSQALAAQGWKYKMQASMLEIYNENIKDLLAIKSNAGKVGGKQQPEYKISHDAEGNTCVSDLTINTCVSDLTIVDVCSIGQVSTLLQKAAHSRSVGRTDMNEESSRSHFVFILRIHGVNESTEQQVQGVLNLIDLAGSERLSSSGAKGQRLKETQAINKSLSSLSEVILALANKEDHIPFRNSKLTYLLQPCLGGDSKKLMFVNVSPDPSSIGQSLCSLRFAKSVNSCKIGIPCRQTIRPLDSRLSCG
nr:kinesin-like protein KIN-14C [Tanacetum cinerariifolium]